MKINLKLKSEITRFMQEYWDSYLKGDWMKSVSLVDDHINMIGSTEGEVYKNKEEVTRFFKDSVLEIAGKVEIRNKEIELSQIDALYLVVENFDVFIIANKEWRFYSKLRVTSLIKKTESGWKLVQQHGSVPDGKVQEGETISFDTITKENLQLKDAIKRRTVELETKSRELEIEASLERVRTQSMVMQHSDELGITTQVFHEQLKLLGIDSDFSYLWLPDDARENHLFWATWDENKNGNVSYFNKSVTYTLDMSEPDIKACFVAWESGEAVHVNPIYKEGVEVYFKTWEELLGGIEKFKPDLFPAGLYYVDSYMKYGCFGIVIKRVLTDVEKSMLKRFALEFERTYTRFLDLQKAEEQAREAQIEAALERIRSRSMAMHKSEELADLSFELVKQVQGLGTATWFCAFNIYDDDPAGSLEWGSNEFGTYEKYRTPREGIFLRYYEAGQKGANLLINEIGEDECPAHYEYLCSLPGVGEQLLQMKAAGISFPTFQIDHVAFFKYGYILFITFEPVPESHDIFRRFAKVFQQTYTRFLDLKKAEAQTRDAQISLAVERVRAKALAMFKSEEIIDVVYKLKEEVLALNIQDVVAATIHLKEENGKVRVWDISSMKYEQDTLHFPLDITYLLDETDPGFFMRKIWSGSDDYFMVVQNQEDLRCTIRWLRIHGLNEEATETEQFMESTNLQHLYHPTIRLNNGRMSLDLLQPPSAEIESILTKMGSAFDLAYKRFEDLKKSEAQAREAKVEAALERVRSQALGMKQSSDLLDIVVRMRQEFIKLGHEAHYFWHMLWLPDKYEKAMTSGDGTRIGMVMQLPRSIHGDIPLIAKWEKSNERTVVFAMDTEVAVDYIDKMITLGDFQQVDPQAPSLDDIRHIGGLTFVMARTTHGEIGYSLPGLVKNPPKEDIETLVRFARAFDFAHKRFQDLIRKEKQVRETEIELALEKIRSRSMAMQNSDELKELIGTLYSELTKLGLAMDRCLIWVMDDVELSTNLWMANAGSQPVSFYVPHHEHPPYQAFINGWRERNKKLEYALGGQDKKEWDEFVFQHTEMKNLPEQIKKNMQASKEITIAASFYDFGCLQTAANKPLSEIQYDVLNRFAKVFDQSYTRFHDLKKAEAQAKEAKIEAALERVRSRSLAMHKTSELQAVIHTVHEELLKLNLGIFGGSFITINKDIDEDLYCWGSGGTANTSEKIHIPRVEKHIYTNLVEGIKLGTGFLTEKYTQQEKKEFFTHLFMHEPWSKLSAKEKKEVLTSSGGYARSCSVSKYTSVIIINQNGKAFSADENDILRRIGKVFEQTYTRFLDLQKAEAQAREAQIEAALEKIRSCSLAMHSTEELGEVIVVIVEKLKELNVVLDANGVILCTYFQDSRDVLHWMASPDFQFAGSYLLPYFDHPIFSAAWKSKEKGDEYFSKAFSIKEKNSFFEYAFEHSDYKKFPDEFKEWIFQNDKHILSFAWQKNSAILIPSHTGIVPGPADIEILKRVAKVFEQAYVRFLDLKKAEIQAREAQIEAALEKVRSRTMAMQSSQELNEAANLLFLEVQGLGIPSWSCGYNLLSQDNKSALCWMSSQGQIQDDFTLYFEKEISFIRMYDFFQSDETFWIQELGGKDLESHYQYMRTIPKLGVELKKFDDSGIELPTFQINHFCKFRQGYLLFITYEPVPEAHEIFKRFTKVFDQTYTRFQDLQKAESMARNANIEVALERVRARALAMQKPEELTQVAEVFRKEMGLLGVEELETCSIFINDNKNNRTECWYALKDNKSSKKGLIIDHFKIDYPETWVGREMLDFYSSKEKQKSIVLTSTDRIDWDKYCKEKSKPFRDYYGDDIPDRTFHLYKFSHGAIGAISLEDISMESWQLLKRAASAFSLAYSRFNDLTKARIDLIQLKDEKKRAEDALSELQLTQAQLIQAEKMASLGELTAGIAHEIQNPLNFVNNFSEVSTEMIDEANEEMKKGDVEEVKYILQDLKGNLEKITHHGRRAESIVKGMLMHSRTSKGEKMPTDINALCDEFLRLSYHGLRAKDRTFNADFETNFDEKLPKISVIPQDIGRVMLNLINNAFQATKEMTSLQAMSSREPKVEVATKNLGGKIEISIIDNGPGIPDNIKEKIFQPFFTTKPTGQGTGLGLSLAYDIVKAHGGELKVESIVEKGSNFIIHLPIK
jgi:signal transduction histidine kinase